MKSVGLLVVAVLCLAGIAGVAFVQGNQPPQGMTDPAQPPTGVQGDGMGGTGGGPPMGVPPVAGGGGPPMGGIGMGPFVVPERKDYKDLIPALLEGLGDEDGEVRQSVAYTLARIGKPALKPLLEIFKDPKKPADTRANAAYTIGLMGAVAEEALPELKKSLKDIDVEIRRRVAFAIASIVDSTELNYALGGFGGMPVAMGEGRGKSRLPDPGLLKKSKQKNEAPRK